MPWSPPRLRRGASERRRRRGSRRRPAPGGRPPCRGSRVRRRLRAAPHSPASTHQRDESGVWTSSINSSSPDSATPNSYFVSARISPAVRPRSTPRSNTASAAACDLLPQLGLDQPPLGDLGTRDRDVVGPGCALGRRCDDRMGERVVLAEAVGQPVAVDRPLPAGVGRPQCGVGDPGDVAADDHLDGQRRGRTGDRDVRIGDLDDVVVDDVRGLLEPPRRQLVEDLALVRDAGDDAIEGRQSIGRDEQPLTASVAAERVRHPDLAVASVVERQVDLGERRGAGDGGRSVPTRRVLISQLLGVCDAGFEDPQAEVGGPPPPRR